MLETESRVGVGVGVVGVEALPHPATVSAKSIVVVAMQIFDCMCRFP
jgi:hypothetical protein